MPLMAAGFITSCVESEQNPYYVEMGDNNHNEIEAKLPNPEHINFSVGDEVIIKRTGFTGNDEIYLCNIENGNEVNIDDKIKTDKKSVQDSYPTHFYYI